MSNSVGLNIREQATSRSECLGLLLRDSLVEVGEHSPDKKWARIVRIVEGGIESVRADGSVPPEAARGWVFLPELDAESAPANFEQVIPLDPPHPIKQGDIVGYLGEDVPARAQPMAGAPVTRKLLHLEMFSRDDVPAYLTASRQWARQHVPDSERTLLVLRPGDTLLDTPNGKLAFTLKVPHVAPLSTLEAKEVDGKRWRKLTGLSVTTGGAATGWVLEEGRLASPWEWPGFEVLDDTANESGSMWKDLADAVGAARREAPHAEETPFYQALRKLLDSNHDGQVSEEELDAALRDRARAGRIGRIIARHDSEWADASMQAQLRWMKALAEKIGLKAVASVEAETPRANKLPWWDEVAAGVEGFPKSPKVYHFHPGGVAGCFITTNRCVLTRESFISIFGDRKIFNHANMPRGGDTYNADIGRFIDLLNEGFSRYGFKKCTHKHHFLSQCFHESDHFNTTVEYASGWDYDVSRYPASVCDVNSAEYTPRKCKRRKQILREGNTTPGDGPAYKGKGIIQLTWKGTYEAYGRHSGVDVAKNPMKIAEDLATAVDTAFWFWAKFKGEHLNGKIDRFQFEAEAAGLKGDALDDEVVRRITRVVNGGDRGLTERQKLFKKIRSVMR